VFIELVDHLVQHGSIPREEVDRLLGLQPRADMSVLEPYASRLDAFRAGTTTLDKAAHSRPALQAISAAGSSAMRPDA